MPNGKTKSAQEMEELLDKIISRKNNIKYKSTELFNKIEMNLDESR